MSMGMIAEWNGHSFVVSPSLIQSFRDLKITGSVETKKVTTVGSEQAVAVKNNNARNVTLTAILSTAAGCGDVKGEALNFVEEATNGEEAYFYVGGEKLFICMMMLTKASVGTIEISPGGVWTYAEVEMTLEQSSKLDGQKAKATSTAAKKTNDKEKKTAEKLDIAKKALENAKKSVTSAVTSKADAGCTAKSVLSVLNKLQNEVR